MKEQADKAIGGGADMHAPTTLSELFGGPWGIVEARRWMIDFECQYIIFQNVAYFERESVKKIAKLRAEIQASRKKKDVK